MGGNTGTFDLNNLSAFQKQGGILNQYNHEQDEKIFGLLNRCCRW